MQEEVTQKVIALSIKAAKLDAAVLQKALKMALKQMKKQHDKPKHGKQTMRQLTKSGEQVTNIKITDQNIKAFDPIARKYNLDYHVKKIEGGEVPRYLVFFKGKDIDSMTEAFREFSTKKLNRRRSPLSAKPLQRPRKKQSNSTKTAIRLKIWIGGGHYEKSRFEKTTYPQSSLCDFCLSL